MLEFEMGLTGITRKEVAGIIGKCVETKPVYKGGLTYQFNIADWTVFKDAGVEPEKADGDAGDDYKVGIGIPDSPQQNLDEIFIPITGTYTYIDEEDGIQKNLSGFILLANIVTVSKARLGQFIGELKNEINEMGEKILTSLGLYNSFKNLRDKVMNDKKFIKKSIDENYRLKKVINEVVKFCDDEITQDVIDIINKYGLEETKILDCSK